MTAVDAIFQPGNTRTFIIAEIGSNHKQDLDLAFQSIDAAVEAGADAAKFQSMNIDCLYYAPSGKIRDLHRQIDLAEDWHQQLKAYCDKRGIIFFSTPTYLHAVKILQSLDVSLYKLASAQVGTFPQLVEKVARTEKPVLLSTGLTTYGELERAVSVFRKADNSRFAILHCNSIYPTPYDKVNLRLIPVYKSMFGNPVGFSDHTQTIYAAIAAVSIGAVVIEKHFTISKSLDAPDTPISLDVDGFKNMVEGIRAVEKAMHFQERITLEAPEKRFKESIRYRLILKNGKKKGAPFSKNDFDFKRHSEGVDARDIDIVVTHMQSAFALEKEMLLTWGMLKGKINDAQPISC